MAFEHLKRYTRPPYFADCASFERREHYVAIGQNRDSDTITRSNFRVMLQRLGGETETVFIVRDRHFLCGWVEAIYIHESDTQACETADRLLADLADYPILSEDDHSELEWTETADYWAGMSVRERVEWITRANAYNEYTRVDHPIPVFAARRDELPEDPAGRLFELLTRV